MALTPADFRAAVFQAINGCLLVDLPLETRLRQLTGEPFTQPRVIVRRGANSQAFPDDDLAPDMTLGKLSLVCGLRGITVTLFWPQLSVRVQNGRAFRISVGYPDSVRITDVVSSIGNRAGIRERLVSANGHGPYPLCYTINEAEAEAWQTIADILKAACRNRHDAV